MISLTTYQKVNKKWVEIAHYDGYESADTEWIIHRLLSMLVYKELFDCKQYYRVKKECIYNMYSTYTITFYFKDTTLDSPSFCKYVFEGVNI